MTQPPFGTLETFDDIASISRRACDDLISLCRDAIGTRGVCRIALAGGSTPQLLYRLMAENHQAFDWTNIQLFWGDERNVLPDHADSNFRMVREALLDHAPVPGSNVFGVPIDPQNPAATAQQYEATLKTQFGSDTLDWDLVLLGMGDDAHTASLFPETKAIDPGDRLFTENWVEKFDTFRQTLTATAINSSRNVWFLIGGAGKREALRNVWGTRQDVAEFPSQLIRPTSGNLRWMIAQDALPERG